MIMRRLVDDRIHILYLDTVVTYQIVDWQSIKCVHLIVIRIFLIAFAMSKQSISSFLHHLWSSFLFSHLAPLSNNSCSTSDRRNMSLMLELIIIQQLMHALSLLITILRLLFCNIIWYKFGMEFWIENWILSHKVYIGKHRLVLFCTVGKIFFLLIHLQF